MAKDCNPNWTTCPLAKRVWLQNNMGITKKIKREVLREYSDWKTRAHFFIWENDDLLEFAKQAKGDGLYAEKTGLRDIVASLGKHVRKAYGITRVWTGAGWHKSHSGERFKRDRGLPVQKVRP